jgi:hypothetical protein
MGAKSKIKTKRMKTCLKRWRKKTSSICLMTAINKSNLKERFILKSPNQGTGSLKSTTQKLPNLVRHPNLLNLSHHPQHPPLCHLLYNSKEIQVTNISTMYLKPLLPFHLKNCLMISSQIYTQRDLQKRATRLIWIKRKTSKK